MQRSPLHLLELGSNSLKFYQVTQTPEHEYTIETHKVPWRVAHLHFANDAQPESAFVDEVLRAMAQVRELAPSATLDSALCLATGVFRESGATRTVAHRMREIFGVRLRVISGHDEARLMARGYTPQQDGTEVLVDLGGATAEWAVFEHGQKPKYGSLPLGAIRMHCAGQRDANAYAETCGRACAEACEGLPSKDAKRLLVTGGSGKALAADVGSPRVASARLAETIERVIAKGPPPEQAPARQEVYLAGLLALEALLQRSGAPELEYNASSVREGMASRLVTLLKKKDAKDLHATLLLETKDLTRLRESISKPKA